MTRVVCDAQLREKLLGLTEPLDFCDEQGRLLGTFRPTDERLAEERRAAILARPPITEAELERRRHEPDFSTEEVLKHLESL